MNNIKKVFQSIKAHPIPIIFFIIAFIASSTLVSLWTSNLTVLKSLALQKTEGIPENTLNATVLYRKKIDRNEIVKLFELISDESNITLENIDTNLGDNEDTVSIVLEYLKKTPIWRYPLISGRDYTKEEVMNGENKVLIGKNIEDRTYIEDKVKKINIKGEVYEVVGVIGRYKQQSPWDNDIYIPIKAIPKSLEIKFSPEKPFSFLLKNNIENPRNDCNKMEEYLASIKGQLIAKEIDKKSDIIADYFANNQKLSSLTLLVFIVALINMMSISIYWIDERSKEIAIRKAFGTSNRNIIYMLSKELFSIFIISFFYSFNNSVFNKQILYCFGNIY